MSKPPVLIIGMARSGTTLISHVLGNLPDVHVEVEPHALWRTGNFKYLNDEEYNINKKIVRRIRNKLTQNLNGKTLIEKSPINVLRPDLVHAVFPEAKIVYIERDPVRCIHSNYKRSISKDSFKLSIILKKYFVYTGSKDLAGAISSRKLFQQISLADVPQFLRYTAKMFYLRQVSGVLPFGPKLKNFAEIVRQTGLLAYHTEVYKKSLGYQLRFKELYGNNMEVFKMENIMMSRNEIQRMVEFVNMPYTLQWGGQIQDTLNKERINQAIEKHDIDKEIEKLLM